MAKRRQAVSVGPPAGTIWASSWDDFLPEPRRRSWPYGPTKLERLAERAGVDSHVYRELLARAVQQRLRERGHAWKALDQVIDARASAARSPD